MNKELKDQISFLKEKFASEGLIIEGVFGSYVRGDFSAESDIDILIELNEEFKSKYKGFKAISRLDEIENYISDYLHIKADLVQRGTLNKVARKYILPEVTYV